MKSTPSITPAAIMSRAPPGASSSACWKMNRTSPSNSRPLSSRAAPSSIAVCPSCPHACIAPGRSDANSTPLSSSIGSASMSARSATTGPPLPIRAITLVSVGRSTSRPKPSSVSATNAEVSCSSKLTSGLRCKCRRQATTSSSTPAILIAYPGTVVDSRRLDVLARNNVRVSGRDDGRPMVFAHGFGCDQNMWRFVAPAFEADHRVVLFDHVGAGGSDLNAYDPVRYGTLSGYADDVIEICRALDLSDAVFVGHSVSSMIGVLAAAKAPECFGALVLVGPSPRYIDDEGYVGGFTRADIDELLESMECELPRLVERDGARDHGQPGPAGARCGADRELLPHRPGDRRAVRAGDVHVRQPRRSRDRQRPDARTPVQRRRDRARRGGGVRAPRDPGSIYRHLAATGHCPNLSAPEETIEAIRAFL